MHINGACIFHKEDGTTMNAEILNADIFENNNTFKASLAIMHDSTQSLDGFNQITFNNFAFGQNSVIKMNVDVDFYIGGDDMSMVTVISDTDHAINIMNDKILKSTDKDPFTMCNYEIQDFFL